MNAVLKLLESLAEAKKAFEFRRETLALGMDYYSFNNERGEHIEMRLPKGMAADYARKTKGSVS